MKHYPYPSGWFGGKWYVDLLKKEVTEKFLDKTLEAYANVPEIKKEFGKRVPGIFTDEPHPAGPYSGTWMSWNEQIPKLFEKQYGYSLIDHLPSLQRQVGEATVHDWKSVRHDYCQLMLKLFVENWAKPYFERSEKYGLELTGHYMEHGWPGVQHGADHMAMYIWHQRPAIDLLMNTYNDGSTNAQFGNVRIVKELASIANQMGRSRTLSENYGAGGWDLRFEDMKRLGDWSYALGVNTLNEHLSYVTIRGARKRDHPQSFSYHSSWFEQYHVMADYFTRLSYMLSQGLQINRIVVIEPTTTAWMYQGDPKLGSIGQSFTDLVNALERNQVEYDLASEDTIARFGKVDGKTFSINKGQYNMVILPEHFENIGSKTLALLDQYLQNDGVLIAAGELPNRVDGNSIPSPVRGRARVGALPLTSSAPTLTLPPSGEGTLLTAFRSTEKIKRVALDEAVKLAKERTAETGLLVNVPEGTRSIFHHRRILLDSEILFICNTDKEKSVEFTIESPKWASHWSLYNGKLSDPTPLRSDIKRTLRPSGSVLFVLTDESIEGIPSIPVLPTTPAIPSRQKLLAGSETRLKRLEPNVLTLDYVDVKVGEEERKDIYTWQANRWIYQKHGFEAGNPWDNQVQFKDELLKKEFPENSSFEATYRFFSRHDFVPKELFITIERPDLYTITCNREPATVSPSESDWYLDKSFGKIDISKLVKPGENTVKIVANPMTIYHELEPAYLLGDFSLESAEKGFVVYPHRRAEFAINGSGLGQSDYPAAWNQQGMPFYAGKVEYSRSFDIDKKAGRYFVKSADVPTSWYGAVARIVVNGKEVQSVFHSSWRIDVTDFITSGKNEIAMIVYGTPKNLFGPHHSGKLRGSAWPGSFHGAPEHQPPGSAYDNIGYGLFEAFELEQVL